MNKLFKSSKKSISTMLFMILFSAISTVLIVGFVIISIFAPIIYCNYTMREIENSVYKTVQRYDIDLSNINKEDLNSTTLKPNNGDMQQTSPSQYEGTNFKDDVSEDEYSVLLFNYVLSSLSISNASKIVITDNNDEVIYSTPHWFMESMKGLRPELNSRRKGQLFFLQDRMEESRFISRTSNLDIDDGYYLKVSLDITDFVQNMIIIRRLFMYLMVIGAVFAIIFASFLSHKITEPLKDLRIIAKKMENMDFTSRYESIRVDEIGDLGRTLNHMMDRLNETINKLKAELDKEKQADVLRKGFIAQVSHELKTPVAVISNYVEALQDGVAASCEEQDTYYLVIEKECRKIGHIINDLLDLSQMEAGTFKVEFENFDITQLLNSVFDKYCEVVSQEIDMIKEINTEETLISGDAIRIEQVIENLMTNAIKHTEDGGFIKVSSRLEGNMVHIQVENEGNAIDENLRIHIWDSFVKGEREQGAGIGLSIVKNIVELHKGEYYIQNKEHSVIFGIRMPIKSIII